MLLRKGMLPLDRIEMKDFWLIINRLTHWTRGVEAGAHGIESYVKIILSWLYSLKINIIILLFKVGQGLDLMFWLIFWQLLLMVCRWDHRGWE